MQLTIHKLEEELSLYRNGTNVAELLELIKEKDTDISAMKQTIASKDENIRKLFKSSSELLSKHESLQEIKEVLSRENEVLKSTIESMNQDISNKQQAILSLELRVNEVIATVFIKDKQIETINGELSAQEEMLTEEKRKCSDLTEDNDLKEATIQKLHKRCADLVKSKGDKVKELDTERQDMITQVQTFRVSRKKMIVEE